MSNNSTEYNRGTWQSLYRLATNGKVIREPPSTSRTAEYSNMKLHSRRLRTNRYSSPRPWISPDERPFLLSLMYASFFLLLRNLSYKTRRRNSKGEVKKKAKALEREVVNSCIRLIIYIFIWIMRDGDQLRNCPLAMHYLVFWNHYANVYNELQWIITVCSRIHNVKRNFFL